MTTDSVPHLTDDGAPTGDRATASANASEKTLLVLEAALTHSRFSKVVEATGLAKATTHRILGTLLEHGFVALAADGSYLPGPKILSLAGRALERIDISAIAQPFVDDLVAKVHCTVHVGVVNGDEIVYLIRSDSDKPYRMPSRVGNAIPLHSSGIGKAVLSGYTDDSIGLGSPTGRSTRSPRSTRCAPRSRPCASSGTPWTARRTYPGSCASPRRSGTTPGRSPTASASRR
jgi:hypothetical protein